MILQPLDTKHLEVSSYFDYAYSIKAVLPKAVHSKETKSLYRKCLMFQSQHFVVFLFSFLQTISVSMIALITYLFTCILSPSTIYLAIPLPLEYNLYESRESTSQAENSAWHYKNHCTNLEWGHTIINNFFFLKLYFQDNKMIFYFEVTQYNFFFNWNKPSRHKAIWQWFLTQGKGGRITVSLQYTLQVILT